jgi:hypothetical protein
LTSVSYTTRFGYIINPDLANQNSLFSKSQCGDSGWISWSNLDTQTIRHEYNSATQSHYAEWWNAIASSSGNNNMGSLLEAYIGIVGENLQQVASDLNRMNSTTSTNINNAAAVEPYPVNFSETGQFLGNINYGPNYASCN